MIAIAGILVFVAGLLVIVMAEAGGRVVSRHVQRRGVSHGGVASMGLPFSRRTLISPGKAREIAQVCRVAKVDVVVFANPLTEHQHTVLGDMFGCLVISGADLVVPGR